MGPATAAVKQTGAARIGAMASFDPNRPLVHPLPGPDRVERRSGLVYARAGGRELAMDLYRPAGSAPGSPLPAVLLVHGEADPALLRGVRGWGQYAGWGRLLAADGMAGVAFEHRAVAEAGFEAVAGEVAAALAAVADRAGELGLDPGRLALTGFSAGVPLAAAALARQAGSVRCAALCYGALDRLDPAADLPPLLVVRAGLDHRRLNRTIDAFLATARGLPVELVDHAKGHHGFDTVDDTDASRDAIRRVLAFLRRHLLG
jgi:acetyl esterase/lipase